MPQQLLSSFSTQINQAPSAHASIVKNYSNKQQGALTKTVSNIKNLTWGKK
jgi:hypothetical protein